jgi:mycothiol synthase
MSSRLLRPAREIDAGPIAALFTETFGGWRPTDAGEVRGWLANAEIPAENMRVLEVDGRVVGYGDIRIEDDVELDTAAPGHWQVFLDWAEERARAAGVSSVRAFFPHGHELETVVAASGYRYWRSAFTMRIDLDQPPLAPPPPAGCELRTYRDEDAEPLRRALNEAFKEDPFWHAVSPGAFDAFYLRHRGFDPTLWLLAWDGPDPAGFVLGWPSNGSDETTGWIGNLGVRPQWRRRGLGGALLQHAFRALYERGQRRVGLGVDAENPTGALGLYERAGMRRVLRHDNWVKGV